MKRKDSSTPLRSAQNDRIDRNGYGPSLIPWEGCFVCGRNGPLQRHEVFHGPYREKSKRYGCWAGVCQKCHDRIHRDAGLDRKLKRIFQAKCMEANGWDLDAWREVFGKNYEEECRAMPGATGRRRDDHCLGTVLSGACRGAGHAVPHKQRGEQTGGRRG